MVRPFPRLAGQALLLFFLAPRKERLSVWLPVAGALVIEPGDEVVTGDQYCSVSARRRSDAVHEHRRSGGSMGPADRGSTGGVAWPPWTRGGWLPTPKRQRGCGRRVIPRNGSRKGYASCRYRSTGVA